MFMATDHPRRGSTVAAPPPTIPPAPPLPPSRYGARSALARFAQPLLGYGARLANTQATRPDGGKPHAVAPRIAGVTPLSSQDATHKTGLEIKALDISPEKTHAIVAGREILKTVRIDGTKCTEDFNLRSAISNHLSSNSAGPRRSLDIHDVKWSHSQYKSCIATAASNGVVNLYDLNRAGVELGQLASLREHDRQVHRIAFNPFSAHLLLSGSQDSTVKLWDLRVMTRDAVSCPSRSTYLGQSEIVRDLRWSPTDGVEFAFGTDNGVIQRWDYRYPKAPKLKLNAHDTTCHSIDWHPDGKHLVSASADCTLRVWNFSSDNRRQKPLWQIRTPYTVLNVAWRPPSLPSKEEKSEDLLYTQVATSYRDHPLVHIWDFRRPFVPFKEIRSFNTAPTDLLWKDDNLLWTVTGGREGMFSQTDVHFAPKTMDRRNPLPFAISSSGEITVFALRKPRQRPPDISYHSEDDQKDKRGSPEKTGFGRGSAESSVDDSYLSSSFRKRHGRTASNRSTKSVGNTPPSDDLPKQLRFDEVMAKSKDEVMPRQVAFRGQLPGTFNVPIYSYLAQKYKLIDFPNCSATLSISDVERIFEQNAEYAQRAAFYRLAQSWRIMGAALAANLRKRLAAYENIPHEDKGAAVSDKSNRSQEAVDRVPPSATSNPVMRAVMGAEKSRLGTYESSSNMATPLARPSVTIPEPEETLSLPPSAVDLSPPNNTRDRDRPLTAVGDEGPRPSGFDSPHMFDVRDDLDQRRAKISGWKAQPRTPLTLDQPVSKGINISEPPPLGRYDSNESFFMFSASSGSHQGASIPNSLSSRPARSPMPRGSGSWDHAEFLESSQSQRSGVSSREAQSPGQGSMVDSQDSLMASQNLTRSPFLFTGQPKHRHDRKASEDNPVEVPGKSSGELEVRSKIMRDMSVLRLGGQRSTGPMFDFETSPFARKDSSEVSLNTNEHMENSGTIVAEGKTDQLRSPVSLTVPATKKNEASENVTNPHGSDAGQANDAATLADLLASTSETDTELESPFTVVEMLTRLIEFHTDVLADSQSAALFLLLVVPLLPPTHPLPEPQVDRILAVYAELFAGMGMPPEEIASILTKNLARVTSTGINPLQVESILLSYHDQLVALGLLNPAVALRRASYPMYPRVYEMALKNTTIGLLCQDCKKPIINGRNKMICENCKGRQARCPICWLPQSPFPGPGKKKPKRDQSHGRSGSTSKRQSSSGSGIPPSADKAENVDLSNPSPQPATSHQGSSPPDTDHGTANPQLWTWCALCGHGGHAQCMATWFGDPAMSEGACPTEGCLCDCVPGRTRDEKLAAASGKRGKTVRGDEWKVKESKAVKGVKGVLAKGSSGGEPSGHSGRRVGFAEPEYET